MFDLSDPWAFFIVSALKAKELFTKDKEYIIKDNELFIVDSFTGRVMEGRRFTDGIQQAIEAKEGMQVSAETEVIGKVLLLRNQLRHCPYMYVYLCMYSQGNISELVQTVP